MPEKTGLNPLDAHLKKMDSCINREEQKEYIKKMSFEKMAQIVLAAREAFINHVDKAIPPFNTLPILLIIGYSSAGKSTTFSFLCGKKMMLECGIYYSDNEIIGYELAESKTFLPNIAKTNRYIIIDYPGFEHNGPCIDLGLDLPIDLGIDLALKAHLFKYQPEVLVIDSITAIRFAASGKLRRRLSRLIKDYENTAVLGITQYSRDYDYFYIQQRETQKKQQQKERQEPSQEETVLEARINVINEILIEMQQSEKEKLEEQLQMLQEKLHKLQNARETQALPDNPEKEIEVIRLEEKEQILLKEIGLNKFIQLKELESPDRLELILEELKNKCSPCAVEPQYLMDEEHRYLLKKKFTNDFITHWVPPSEAQRVQKKFNNFAEVEKSITESSLINTVLAEDIGVLFHLPEMPVSFLKEMDKNLMASFLGAYLKSVIKLISTCSEDLKKLPDDDNAKLLQREIKNLQRDLDVLELKRTEEKKNKLIAADWEINLDDRSVSERFTPSWMNNFIYLNPKVPSTLVTLSQKIPKEISATQAGNAIAEIELLKNTLEELLKINEVVDRTQILLSEKQQKREEQRKRDEQRLREEKQKKKKEETNYQILDQETVTFFKDTRNTECVGHQPNISISTSSSHFFKDSSHGHNRPYVPELVLRRKNAG